MFSSGTTTYATSRPRLLLIAAMGVATMLGMSACTGDRPEAGAGEEWAARKFGTPAPSRDDEQAAGAIAKPENDDDAFTAPALIRSMNPSGAAAGTPSRGEPVDAPDERGVDGVTHHPITARALERVALSNDDVKMLDVLGSVLDATNTRIELHRVRQRGDCPELVAKGWSSLEDGSARGNPPANPFTPDGRHASTVHPIEAPLGERAGWAQQDDCHLLAVIEHDLALRLGLVEIGSSAGVRTDYVVTY